MAYASWQPKWWTKEQHESAWNRVKDSMRRDWEQTKFDMSKKGVDLDQDVDDTVKQAVGKDMIPGQGQKNAPKGTPLNAQSPQRKTSAVKGTPMDSQSTQAKSTSSLDDGRVSFDDDTIGTTSSARMRNWEDIEPIYKYGYGAYEQYGSQYPSWNDKLETKLKSEWEEAKARTGKAWNDVKAYVRRGYEKHI